MKQNDASPRLPSGKEVLVLKLLASQREMYGLEMVKAEPDLKRGTVYVLLSRMEEKGFITSEQEKEIGVSGMPRRLYRISGLGQRAFYAWNQAQSAFGYGIPALAGGA